MNRGKTHAGCDNVIVDDARRFLTEQVERIRPDVHIQSYVDPTPAEFEQLRHMLPPTQCVSHNTAAAWDVVAARFLISYEEQGITFDEYVVVAAVIHSLKVSGSMPSVTKITNVLPAFYMRAPAGQLDEEAAVAYGDTMHVDPGYEAMLRTIRDAKDQRHEAKLKRAAKIKKSHQMLNYYDEKYGEYYENTWSRKDDSDPKGSTNY